MKIAIAHYRTGLTDGVSFEIDKRKKMLEELGNEVVLIAGTHAGHLDLYIPEFEYKSNETIDEIQKLAFEPEHENLLKEKVAEVSNRIEKQIEDFWKQEQFEILFIHNVFCLPVCLPGSLAFYNFIKKHPDIKVITIHHDFYWEAPRQQMFAFTNPYAEQILNDIFPPSLPNVTHTVINSLAQKAMKEKRNLEAEIITDTFDFDQSLWQKNEHNKDFLKDCGLTPDDIVFLIGVRVRERKAVELAVDMVAEAAALKETVVDKKKWNGEAVSDKSNVVLLIPGEYTPKEEAYVSKLKERAQKKNVDVRWISDIVGSEEQQEKGERKYALWDCYVYADAVMYTSHWEGWGNQFIEAVFAKKPVVVFEYPVFTSDIKPDGFHITSLGADYTTEENGLISVAPEKVQAAAKEVMAIITEREKYTAIIENNFAVGKHKYNTNTRLKEHLSQFVK